MDVESTTAAATPSFVASSPPPEEQQSRRAALTTQVRNLVRAIQDGDDASVEAAVRQLSSRRRLFAPLGMVVGAFVMLFQGLKLLISNWRLTLVQVLPAMWIWAAMLDFKAHLFYGKSFYVLYGAGLV